jgi:hypothetical protein
VRWTHERAFSLREAANGNAGLEFALGTSNARCLLLAAHAMSYMHKKNLIRSELMKCASAKPMEFPTYTELGARVGIPPQGPS